MRSHCNYTGIVSEGDTAHVSGRALSAREQMIATADALYNSRGIQLVGMDDLRQATGLSLRAMYKMFPSKTALVLEVLDNRHRLWTDGLAARVQLESDPQHKLLAVYDYLAGWFADDTFRGCGFINAFAELGAVEPDIAARVRTHKESFQLYVAHLAQEAHARPDLAPQLAILAEGAQTTAAIAGTTDAAIHARQAAETLIAVALTT